MDLASTATYQRHRLIVDPDRWREQFAREPVGQTRRQIASVRAGRQYHYRVVDKARQLFGECTHEERAGLERSDLGGVEFFG